MQSCVIGNIVYVTWYCFPPLLYCSSTKGVFLGNFQKADLVAWNVSLSKATVDMLLKMLSKKTERTMEKDREHKERRDQSSIKWYNPIVLLSHFIWLK